MTIKVFLLDDHEVVRAGLRALLESHDDITVVGEAGTVAEAFARVDDANPDVAVLDGRLPDGSGIEVCREFRSRKPTMGALILTSYDDDEAVFAAIMAGASGYLLKQAAGKELVGAIRHVAEGGSLLDATVTEKVMKRLREGDPAESDQLAQLTPQERRILELVGEGLTNRQIGERMFLAEKTVKNYMSSVLAKLGVERRTQAALYANKLLKRTED